MIAFLAVVACFDVEKIEDSEAGEPASEDTSSNPEPEDSPPPPPPQEITRRLRINTIRKKRLFFIFSLFFE